MWEEAKPRKPTQAWGIQFLEWGRKPELQRHKGGPEPRSNTESLACEADVLTTAALCRSSETRLRRKPRTARNLFSFMTMKRGRMLRLWRTRRSCVLRARATPSSPLSLLHSALLHVRAPASKLTCWKCCEEPAKSERSLRRRVGKSGLVPGNKENESRLNTSYVTDSFLWR